MAKEGDLVWVRALKSFDTFVEGQRYQVVLTVRMAALIVRDYLQLL